MLVDKYIYYLRYLFLKSEEYEIVYTNRTCLHRQQIRIRDTLNSV